MCGIIKILTKSALKKAILCDNKMARNKFKRIFKSEINQFTENTYNAYKAYKLIDKSCISNKQIACTAAFLFNAIHNLVSSFNILICGYMVPSGNLMRHFFESSAMAILVSNERLSYFEEFDKNPGRFKINEVFRYANQDLDKIGINYEVWKNFIKVKNFYHKLSHSSALSLSTIVIMDPRKKGITLGSFFDNGKINEYKKEINTKIDVAKCLENICVNIAKNIKEGYKQ